MDKTSMYENFIQVKSACPYCGTENVTYIPFSRKYRPFLVLCDIEEKPGCDKYYAVSIQLIVKANAFAIEQEPDNTHEESS